jgi:nucleotidyltransferase substrate binding protein (TIGR01987 family)
MLIFTTMQAWGHKYENYQKALAVLQRIAAQPSRNEAERMGLIKAYEMVNELGWKLLQAILKDKKYPEDDLGSPRDVLRTALEAGIITDGHAWFEALKQRNRTVHTYNEDTADEVENLILTLFLPAFKALDTYASTH